LGVNKEVRAMPHRAHAKRRPEAPAVAVERREGTPTNVRRDFLRMVSHELRTPLNSIIGFSEILNREIYGPLGAAQYKEYAGIIQASGLRLLRLVNQVLELAKLEAGGELELGAEPLDAVFEDAAKTVAPDLAASRCRPACRRRSPQLWPTRGRSARRWSTCCRTPPPSRRRAARCG
jgi:signal transduction histidine kinase